MLIQFSDANGNRYVLDVSHSELFFGSNLVGSNALPQTLALKNVGWADISLPGISVSGSTFSIEGVNPGVLRPGQKIEFEVSFSPTTGGPSTGSIYIDAGVAGTAYVRLYGVGFSTANGNVDITGMQIAELASALATEALLNLENGTKVWVYNDPDLGLNGFYTKNGASGVGSFDGPFAAYSEPMSNTRDDIAIGLASPDANLDILTAGSKRGIHVEHHGSGEGVDLRAFPDATGNLMVLHGYQPYPGINMQSDRVRTGSHLILKNSTNPLFFDPGTLVPYKGTSSFIQMIGYVSLADALPTSLAEWTHTNAIIADVNALPLTVTGAGFVVTSGPARSQCLKATSLGTDVYAGFFTGKKRGIYVTTDTDSGFASVVYKSATGEGTVSIVANKGTGMTCVWADGSFVQKGGIDKDGNVYVGTDKVVGARGAAVADASGGATVDTEARAAINALLARLRAHGMIAS